MKGSCDNLSKGNIREWLTWAREFLVVSKTEAACIIYLVFQDCKKKERDASACLLFPHRTKHHSAGLVSRFMVFMVFMVFIVFMVFMVLIISCCPVGALVVLGYSKKRKLFCLFTRFLATLLRNRHPEILTLKPLQSYTAQQSSVVFFYSYCLVFLLSFLFLFLAYLFFFIHTLSHLLSPQTHKLTPSRTFV